MEQEAQGDGEITPAERALIAAFTQGVISRASPIRVVFTRPMVAPSELNTPLRKSPFRFDPKIEGVAVWTAVDEIELRPQTRLPDGETYGATLELRDLLGKGAELDHFYFVFSTMKQSFQVAVDGLEAADPQDPKAQRLSGKLVTADVDDAARLEPAKSWEEAVKLPGLPGTNEVTLEVSRIPPLDLGRRLAYLIHYPHGCVEQTVSSVFPQLYLGRLLELQPLEKSRIEANVKAGLQRLQQFHTSEGGFGYWPGDSDPNDWASSYAGHFMVEAQNAGYLLPACSSSGSRSRSGGPGPGWRATATPSWSRPTACTA